MPRKRANGEGSFTKKSNSFEYRVCFEKPDGELIRKSFSAKTKRECREKADKFKDSLDNTIKLEKSNLEEWAKKWLETYKKNTVTADTFISYKYDMKIILDDQLAQMEISQIKPIHIQDFFNRISDYAMSRQKKVRSMLVGIFNRGIENNLCTSNPATNIKLTNSDVKTREAYSTQEVDLLTKFAKTHNFGLAIMLILYSGVRRGELLALTWDCYDDIEKIIKVRSTLTSQQGIVFGSVTTKNHDRDIPIPNLLCDILNKAKKDGKYIIGGYNYLTFSQFRTYYNNFFSDFENWCVANQTKPIKKLSAHCLRHTYGTMLYRKNVNLKTIQVLMGHSSIDVTANIYTHTDIDTSKQAIHMAFNDLKSPINLQ